MRGGAAHNKEAELSTNWQDTLERVSTETVAKFAADVDAEGRFPSEALEALGKAGLLGAVSAKEVGGLALGPRGASEIIRRLSQECGSTGMVTCMHYCGTAVLEAFADEATRKAAAKGEHLSTLAFSEAGSRSHLGTGEHRAENSSGVVLDAKKSWVTSASKATAYVWSSRPLAAEGLSTIWLVPANANGLKIQGPFNGLGLRGNDSSPAVAEAVHVPNSAMLGEDGKGFDIMMGVVLPLFNVLNASCTIGLVEAAVAQNCKARGNKVRILGHCVSGIADDSELHRTHANQDGYGQAVA